LNLILILKILIISYIHFVLYQYFFKLFKLFDIYIILLANLQSIPFEGTESFIEYTYEYCVTLNNMYKYFKSFIRLDEVRNELI